MKFNFVPLAPNYMLVILKNDETGLGFEEQVKKYRTSLSEVVLKMDTLEQSLRSFQAQPEVQPKVKGVDSEMLQSRVSVLEGENKKQANLMEQPQETIATQADLIEQLQETTATQAHLIEQLQETTAMQGSMIKKLLKSVELQYQVRGRVLLEKACEKLLTKLQKSPGNLTWKEFIENLSEDEKSRSGASTPMLLEIGTGKSFLNKALHQDGSLEEMGHAVNTMFPPGSKISRPWYEKFTLWKETKIKRGTLPTMISFVVLVQGN